jgi:4'-phosphopantetheinyl transferase EntD
MDFRELDASHVARKALDRMLPFATTAGGSFAHWLPTPRGRTFLANNEILEEARRVATRQCVRTLSGGTALERRMTGYRAWAPGYCGSITHKGTVVLAATAEISTCGALGIDLERVVEGQLRDSALEIAPEGLPSGITVELAATFAFSAKESVFKANFPHRHEPLGFGDVRLRWKSNSAEDFRATAVVGDKVYDVLGALLSRSWLLTAAVSLYPING